MKTCKIKPYEVDGNWFFKFPEMKNPIGPFMSELLAQAAITDIDDEVEQTVQHNPWNQDYYRNFYHLQVT